MQDMFRLKRRILSRRYGRTWRGTFTLTFATQFHNSAALLTLYYNALCMLLSCDVILNHVAVVYTPIWSACSALVIDVGSIMLSMTLFHIVLRPGRRSSIGWYHTYNIWYVHVCVVQYMLLCSFNVAFVAKVQHWDGVDEVCGLTAPLSCPEEWADCPQQDKWAFSVSRAILVLYHLGICLFLVLTLYFIWNAMIVGCSY